MASSSREPEAATVPQTHVVVAIGLGLACLSAVMAGGTFVGNSLSELLKSTELAPPEAINALR
tara:strand:+ start:534 stop:722 length:189 start_codon:yes stop_codon:yes gene_type:complete